MFILNGAPRSGKTSIARAIQSRFAGVWLNLGVDAWMKMTPERDLPGIGLRPGGERPDLEPLVVQSYRGLYEAIAAQSRLGINVVADTGHHDDYSRPLGILQDCARRLAGLPALFVGVRCSLEVIMARRNAEPSRSYYAAGEGVPAPVARWQEAVHQPGIYDLEVDTTGMSPEHCADAIACLLHSVPNGGGAFERLAHGR